MDIAENKVSILIVDDVPANLLALEAVLNSPQYQLDRAGSGMQALNMMKHKEYALVLLDVRMPIMDGFETAINIRRNLHTKNTPIIFITANLDTAESLFYGYEIGAIDYILKPFEPEILRSKVSILIELYLARKELAHTANILRVEHEKNVSSVLENALDAVISMSADGKIVGWNTQASKIFGWSKEETMGLQMSKLIIPQPFRQLHENGLHKFLEEGIGPILNKRIEVSALRKSGEEFPVELTVTPIQDGDIWTFTAFVRDITDRKMAMEAEIIARREKEKLLEEYKQAIEFRDEFISVCSHELNTPITSLKLQFQMAQRALAQGDKRVFSEEMATKRIKSVNIQLDRMIHLIKDMLDVTKMSNGKLILDFKECEFNDIIEEVLDSFKEQFMVLKIKLEYINKATNSKVYGDKYRLEQVISNLITNTLKYGDNKPVTITLENIGKMLSLTVKDEGIGLKEESLVRIFNKYERAVSNKNISGLGVGLYISKQIIESHGGVISVTSQIGKGSTFEVLLPVAD